MENLYPVDAAAVALLGSALQQLPHLTRLTVESTEWQVFGRMASSMSARVERALCRLLQNAALTLSTGTHPLRQAVLFAAVRKSETSSVACSERRCSFALI